MADIDRPFIVELCSVSEFSLFNRRTSTFFGRTVLDKHAFLFVMLEITTPLHGLSK